uniref:Uncharacterized protein n=1 Tax=Taeniopygia guttata TaxID=59729 RepID=A0A674GA22_TAEGU
PVLCIPVFCIPVLCIPVFCIPVLCIPVFCIPVFCIPVLCIPVLCIPVLCSPVLCSPVLCIPVLCSPVLCSPVFCSPVFCSPVFCSPVLCIPVFCIPVFPQPGVVHPGIPASRCSTGPCRDSVTCCCSPAVWDLFPGGRKMVCLRDSLKTVKQPGMGRSRWAGGWRREGRWLCCSRRSVGNDHCWRVFPLWFSPSCWWLPSLGSRCKSCLPCWINPG